MLETLLDKDKLARTGRTIFQSVLAAVVVAVLPMLLADHVNMNEVYLAAKFAAVTTVLAYVSPKRKADKQLELPKLTEPE